MDDQRPGVTCSWCGKPIATGGPRTRLHESETAKFSGRVIASFHPECADGVLDYCEDRVAVAAATPPRDRAAGEARS